MVCKKAFELHLFTTSRETLIWNKKFYLVIWFLFYTWVKHFKEEGTLRDIAPFAAACALSFMLGVIYLIVMLIQMGNCDHDYLKVSFFPRWLWLVKWSLLSNIKFCFEYVLFKWDRRYQRIEAKFNALPLIAKNLGHIISWGCFYFIYGFFISTSWWFYYSDYVNQLCTVVM